MLLSIHLYIHHLSIYLVFHSVYRTLLIPEDSLDLSWSPATMRCICSPFFLSVCVVKRTKWKLSLHFFRCLKQTGWNSCRHGGNVQSLKTLKLRKGLSRFELETILLWGISAAYRWASVPPFSVISQPFHHTSIRPQGLTEALEILSSSIPIHVNTSAGSEPGRHNTLFSFCNKLLQYSMNPNIRSPVPFPCLPVTVKCQSFQNSWCVRTLLPLAAATLRTTTAYMNHPPSSTHFHAAVAVQAPCKLTSVLF